MEHGNAFYNCQTQARSAEILGSGGIDPEETIEDPGQCFGGNAVARIGHINTNSRLVCCGSQRDGSAPRSVRESIGNEITHSSLQESAIEFRKNNIGVGSCVEGYTTFCGDAFVIFAHSGE